MGAGGALFGAAASGVSSMIGGNASANAAQAQAEAQANAYRYNAQVADNNAVAARDAAKADVKQQNRVNSLKHGKLITQAIAQGVELSGTPLMILDEDTAQGALESKKIGYKGEIQARNYQNQAQMQRFYADAAISAGENQANASRTSGLLGAFGSFTKLLGS